MLVVEGHGLRVVLHHIVDLEGVAVSGDDDHRVVRIHRLVDDILRSGQALQMFAIDVIGLQAFEPGAAATSDSGVDP